MQKKLFLTLFDQLSQSVKNAFTTELSAKTTKIYKWAPNFFSTPHRKKVTTLF